MDKKRHGNVAGKETSLRSQAMEGDRGPRNNLPSTLALRRAMKCTAVRSGRTVKLSKDTPGEDLVVNGIVACH